MSSDFNFTVTSWFLENVRKKPYFNKQWGGGQIVMCWAVILICQPRPTGPPGSDRTALEFADGRVSFKMEFGMLHLLHERRWVELAKFTKPYCSYELWLVGSDALTLKEMYLYDFWQKFLFPLFTLFYFCFPSKVKDSSKKCA